MSTDIFGNPLFVGDTVAFNRPKYKCLITGKIAKVNAQQVTIEWVDPSYRTHTSDGTQGKLVRTSEYFENCVKKTQ